MKERIEKLLEMMIEWRGLVLDEYLKQMENPIDGHEKDLQTLRARGRLNDYDQHIDSLRMELMRLDAKVYAREVHHAS